jgi:Protein phosphatase 2C
MWKLLFQSVRGTAHERNQQPCQDSCLTRLHAGTLLLACADGAGSARHADVGARLACRVILQVAQDDLRDGLTVQGIERDTVVAWHVRLRQVMERQAATLEAPFEQLASTLLLAVVGENAAVFAQIGDGAIVVRQQQTYQPVFWPQSGEYANSTNFVTDAEYAEELAFARCPGPVDEIALLTDGLQMLALTFADRGAHQPFFRPMFERLHASRPGEILPRALRQFLTSPAINARCDDDKTLILAARSGEPAA